MTARGCVISALLLLASTAGCRTGGKACTAIGCADQASIAVHRTDWAMLSLAADLDIAGRKVTCAAPLPPQIGGGCDMDVAIEVRELADCHEVQAGGARGQSCIPNGKFEEVITIRGTPPRVTVTLKAGSVVAGERTFDLSYTSAQPNGPGCDPTCHQAQPTWELPATAPDKVDGGQKDAAPADAPIADAATDLASDGRYDRRPESTGDGPGDGEGIDAPRTVSCGTIKCAAGEVCVQRQTVGGPCIQVGDAGCPAGTFPASQCCGTPPSYECAARPPACGSGLTCDCVRPTLCPFGYNCQTPTSDQLRCTLLAP
jgi:hypothetical protein